MTLRRSLVFVFLLWVSMAAAWAAGIGEVTRLVGEADVTRGAAPAQPLGIGDGIQPKDVLRTKKDAQLEVTMSDGSRLTLGESSRLEVTNYTTGEQPDAMLDLTRGRLRSYVTDVFSSRSESFRVRTPTAVVGVQGTDFELFVEALLARLRVYAGIVVAANINPQVPDRRVLRAGQSTVIRENQAPDEPKEFGGGAGFGSGGLADLYFGGDQGNNPLGLTPTVPSSVPTPPIPSPPGR